ncbi:NB-ARC - like 10 [Theobroma cacao]|nr:NB-ARC - like 10 [Theobroma cacao]
MKLGGEPTVKETIWGFLMGDEVGMIGVCGIGGIGKTTIMMHIKIQLLKENKFDKVLWVTMSRKLNVVKLQHDTASAMQKRLPQDEYTSKRAAALLAILGRVRYVLIIDDVHENFSLKDIGIPQPAHSRSKLVLVSRSVEVCQSMGCKVVKVQPLSKEESLDLFLDKVGHGLLLAPTLEKLVKLVVEHFSGLPLSIITIASSMKGVDDVCDWRNLLRELCACSSRVKDMQTLMLNHLNFSFNRLKDPNIQKCVLYCALYPEDCKISRNELIEYWMAEGLVDELGSRRTMYENDLEGEINVKEQIWEYLMGNEVAMIGVCGMGGIGKTTIMKHINNQLLKEAPFDKVIWVTVSKELNVVKLQEDIASACDMKHLLPKNELERATKLMDILKTKRYVLILDDVWKQFSLLQMGIPEPRHDGSKLVITSRSIDVCLSMGCKVLKVQPLSKEESLNLFLNHVGHGVLEDPALKEIVKLVVDQCSGLPLAIVTIAGSMKGVDDVREWHLEGEINVKEQILEYLMGDEVAMIGVCGMGGIGKTTIMKHINNQLLKEARFDKVIWVTVSKELNVVKLQEDIASACDMKDCLPKNELKRATKLMDILKTERYVLILDDVWKRFSLSQVGIPEPTHDGRKLVITSRSIDVCLSMGCKVFKVQHLSKKESLNLFLKHVGHAVLQHPTLKEIVKLIVDQCGGLPLAIVTIAGSMKGVDDVHEWRNALNELCERVKSVRGLDAETFECLMFSYDHLVLVFQKVSTMADTIRTDVVDNVLNAKRRDTIGRFLTNLGKFAVDSAASVSLKGFTGFSGASTAGGKKLYEILQERFKAQPTPPLLNCKRKSEDDKLMEKMQLAKMEDMNEVKQESKTAGKPVAGSEPMKKKKIPHDMKDLGLQNPDRKRIFIRSRL